MDKRKQKQQERGRVVFVIETDGVPETENRRAYRTEGMARAAANAMCLPAYQVTKYVPASDS